jgi:uncharacterized protein (DUF3084 family)
MHEQQQSVSPLSISSSRQRRHTAPVTMPPPASLSASQLVRDVTQLRIGEFGAQVEQLLIEGAGELRTLEEAVMRREAEVERQRAAAQAAQAAVDARHAAQELRDRTLAQQMEELQQRQSRVEQMEGAGALGERGDTRIEKSKNAGRH